jgi:hypothetical protein
MRTDKKFYFLKIEDIRKKLRNLEFQLILWTIVVPIAKKGFWL